MVKAVVAVKAVAVVKAVVAAVAYRKPVTMGGIECWGSCASS